MTGTPRKDSYISIDDSNSDDELIKNTSAWLASSITEDVRKASSSSRRKRGGRGKKKKKDKKSNRKGSIGSDSWDGCVDSEKSVIIYVESKVKKSILKSDVGTFNDKLKKSVKFNQVSIREFSRCMGYDGVPSDGSWPLGLSFEVVSEIEGDIDSFEKRRASELRNRASNSDSDNHLPYEYCHDCADEYIGAGTSKSLPVLETRQFDYKRGQRNPLFKSLSEGRRQDLLLAALDPDHHHESHSKEKKGNKHHHQSHSTRRVRGLSQADLDEMRCNASGVTIEMELDHEALILRNELEGIRDHRSDVGCSCHKIKHTNKLSERRLRDELRKRHLDTSGRKNELSERLKDVIEKEPCCSSGCPCAQEGR